MDAPQYEEFASRWVAGERLAPDEEQFLLQWLEDQPDARADLLEDETLDSLLRDWSRLDETAENFVQDCLRGVAGADANGLAAAAAVEAPPVVAPPVVVSTQKWVARSELRAKGVVCDESTPFASSGTCHPSRFRVHALFAGKSARWAAAVAGCCAAARIGRHRMAVAGRRTTGGR